MSTDSMKRMAAVPQFTAEIPTDRIEASAQRFFGDEPMTGAQASSLKTLCDEAHEPGAYATDLTKKQAARRIHLLRERLRLRDLPPHTD